MKLNLLKHVYSFFWCPKSIKRCGLKASNHYSLVLVSIKKFCESFGCEGNQIFTFCSLKNRYWYGEELIKQNFRSGLFVKSKKIKKLRKLRKLMSFRMKMICKIQMKTRVQFNILRSWKYDPFLIFHDSFLFPVRKSRHQNII